MPYYMHILALILRILYVLRMHDVDVLDLL